VIDFPRQFFKDELPSEILGYVIEPRDRTDDHN
jgi:hypothetical protein